MNGSVSFSAVKPQGSVLLTDETPGASESQPLATLLLRSRPLSSAHTCGGKKSSSASRHGVFADPCRKTYDSNKQWSGIFFLLLFVFTFYHSAHSGSHSSSPSFFPPKLGERRDSVSVHVSVKGFPARLSRTPPLLGPIGSEREKKRKITAWRYW